MKKHTLIVTLLLASTLSFCQQHKKYVLYVQGGYKSSGYIQESAHNEIASAKETAHHKCIVLNAGFLVNIAAKWRIGPAFTYDHFGTKHRSVEFSNLSYMLRCDRTWKSAKTYSLYSGVSLGIRKVRHFDEEVETGRYTTLGYQVCLIGAELKMGPFAIDANAGYGVSGILNFGLKYRF